MKSRLDVRRKALRSHLEHSGRPPGLVRVTDEVFMAAVEAMMAQYPPRPIMTPYGTEIAASTWVVHLAYVDGGKDVLARIESIQRKMVMP